MPLIGDAMSQVGRSSLWIYLLHPFVTEVWRPHDDLTWRGRLIGAALTVAIVAVSVTLAHLNARRRSAGAHVQAAPGKGVAEPAASDQAVESSIDPPLDDEDVLEVPSTPSDVPAGAEIPDVRRGPLTAADTHVLEIQDIQEIHLPDAARQPR